jgi:hypothetical protein
MTMTSRKFSQALLPALFAAMMVAHPWAMAAADPDPDAAVASPALCASGTADCLQGKATVDHREASSHHRQQKTCAPDDQDCDTRTRDQRRLADVSSRDRHSCRD